MAVAGLARMVAAAMARGHTALAAAALPLEDVAFVAAPVPVEQAFAAASLVPGDLLAVRPAARRIPHLKIHRYLSSQYPYKLSTHRGDLSAGSVRHSIISLTTAEAVGSLPAPRP